MWNCLFIYFSCEIEIDECSFSPCLNNGTCQNLIGSFKCDCSETNFVGELCEIDVTRACNVVDSPNDPCQNGGICTNVTNNNQVVNFFRQVTSLNSPYNLTTRFELCFYRVLFLSEKRAKNKAFLSFEQNRLFSQSFLFFAQQSFSFF